MRLHASFRSSHWPASTARTVIGSHFPASAGFEGIGRGWGEGDALWDRHSRLRPGPCRHWSGVLGFRGGNRCPLSRAGLRPRASRAFRFGRAGDAARAGWLQTLGQGADEGRAGSEGLPGAARAASALVGSWLRAAGPTLTALRCPLHARGLRSRGARDARARCLPKRGAQCPGSAGAPPRAHLEPTPTAFWKRCV